MLAALAMRLLLASSISAGTLVRRRAESTEYFGTASHTRIMNAGYLLDFTHEIAVKVPLGVCEVYADTTDRGERVYMKDWVIGT